MLATRTVQASFCKNTRKEAARYRLGKLAKLPMAMQASAMTNVQVASISHVPIVQLLICVFCLHRFQNKPKTIKTHLAVVLVIGYFRTPNRFASTVVRLLVAILIVKSSENRSCAKCSLFILFSMIVFGIFGVFTKVATLMLHVTGFGY